METMEIDLANICRTCGCSSNSEDESTAPFSQLFKTNPTSRLVSAQVRELLRLFQFSIYENDQLPQQICENCETTFEAINEFRFKCEKMQSILEAMMQISDTKEMIPEEWGTVENTEFILQEEYLSDEDLKIETSSGNPLASDDETKINDSETLPLETDESSFQGNDEDENKTSIADASEMSDNTEEGNSRSSEKLIKTKQTIKKYILSESLRPKETCRFCKEEFFRVRYHTKTCRKRDVEICFYCDLEFRTLEELNQHINERHENKLPACKLCFASFPKRKDLLKHRERIHDDGKQECETCGRIYRNSYNLRQHIWTAHSTKVNKTCRLCKKILSTKTQYDYHMLQHNPDARKYACNECDKSFYLKHHFEQHMRRHNGEKPFLCELCGKGFSELKAMTRHRSKHDEFGTNSNQTRRRHRRITHEENRISYKCSVNDCKKVFWNGSLLKKHKILMHAETNDTTDEGAAQTERATKERVARKGNSFQCEHCSREFNGSASFAIHLRCHEENRKFKCEYCGVGFKRNSHLHGHIQRIHMKEKKFACPHCNLKFPQKYELNAHLCTHNDDRRYKCTECSSMFKWRQGFRTHMALVHSQVRPYPCSACDKSFISSSFLESHILTKHPLKQFQLIRDLVDRKTEEMGIENAIESA